MLFLLLVPYAVWALCAVCDVSAFRIPNRYIVVLMVAWPAALVLTGAGWDVMVGGLITGGLFLLVGFALFTANLLGAGDAKLMAASGLWLGPAAAVPFLLYTTLSGAALGLLLLRLRAVPLPVFARGWPWLVQLHARERVMPYGVAIAVGGIIALPRAALIGG